MSDTQRRYCRNCGTGGLPEDNQCPYCGPPSAQNRIIELQAELTTAQQQAELDKEIINGYQQRIAELEAEIVQDAANYGADRADVCIQYEQRIAELERERDEASEKRNLYFQRAAHWKAKSIRKDAELAALREQVRWIPVSEGFPTETMPVLVRIRNPETDQIGKPFGAHWYEANTLRLSDEIDAYEGCTEIGNEWFVPAGFYEQEHVDDMACIHQVDYVAEWMPLPPAPKGEGR